jgi:ATP phosphoribosyltransferase
MHADVIQLYGSMELAPLVGLADVIVDLVSTGNTLRANDLVAVEDIMPITSRLIVNPGALKLKRAQMQPLIDALARATATAPTLASLAAPGGGASVGGGGPARLG